MSDFNDQAEPQRGNPHDEEPVPAEPEAHDVHPDDAAHRRTEAQLQRAVADLANLRKRTHRDIDDARRRMVEAMSADLLPVLDNFHLALGAQDAIDASGQAAGSSAMADGMRMVKGMLEDVLARHGLAEIEAEGRPFDPNFHEAVGVDSESPVAPGLITQVLQRGYRIDDKVLRASRVIVRGESKPGDPA